MRSSGGDWPTNEEQTSINLPLDHQEESTLLGDVEIGNIQDHVKFLLHSAQNYRNINSPSIYMIPSRIRDLNPRVFNPRQVSIGPLHRKNKNLQAFEKQKAIFLHDLLLHSEEDGKQEKTLETCVQKVNASIEKIKACYGNGVEGYSDDDITRMMVMDGFFILEFVYKFFKGSFDEDMVIEPLSMVFDLMLIENQIPFFVLQHIFECTSSRFKPEVASLSELIINGLVPIVFFFKPELTNNEIFNRTHNHILGFMHECCKPSGEVKIYRFPSQDMNQFPRVDRFYTVVELDRAGVNYKPHRHCDQRWSMDIQFKFPLWSWCRPWAKPTLIMPILGIHNYTELIFRNLIAYEQVSPRRVWHYVTSYVIALDMLIDNHEDVDILVKSNVLINTIGSNEEAAKLINDMRKEICSADMLYLDVWKDVEMYHNRFWPRNIAWLRRTYFSNPWSIIALFAGIFLFLLTMVQTYFTVNPV